MSDPLAKLMNRLEGRLIESPEDAAKALLRKRSAQAASDFKSSVRPIYALLGSAKNPELKHAGSCILLNIEGYRVLSTAAHILDDIDTGVLLSVGGALGTHPVPIVGGLRRKTKAPRGDRKLDHIDCGFWKMPGDAVRALGAVEFLDASRLSHNRAAVDRRYYMALGYPLSRNKRQINQAARSIGNRLARYSGSVVDLPELATRLGMSGNGHMFLAFDEKQVYSEDDRRVNAYEPKGFSGGALLDLGDFTNWDAYETDTTHHAALSGMLIEHNRRHRAMVAVKIGSIVSGIRRYL